MPRPASPAGEEPVVLPTFRGLARRALPQALEAAIIPAALFLLVSNLAGTTLAIGAVLAWGLAVVGWRWLTRRRVSGMTFVAATRLLARSVIAIAADSRFVYFLQPVIGGVCLAGAFAGSVLLDRPLARRFARDFCTLPKRVLQHARVHRFFRRVSLLWSAVGLANAAIGLCLLVTQSTNVYLIVSTLLSVGITAAALAGSMAGFRRTLASVYAR